MRDLLVSFSQSGIIGSVLVTVFFVFFVGLVSWVYRRDRKARYEDVSRMPLEETGSDNGVN